MTIGSHQTPIGKDNARFTPRRSDKTAQPEIEFFYDVEQRTEEWLELRRGIPTASHFAAIMAASEDRVGREKYMKLLAGEIVSGQVAETFRNEFMARGNRVEPEARAWYQQHFLTEVRSVGFVKRTMRRQFPFSGSFMFGCSPDGQVGKRKGAEFKSMAPHLLIDVVSFPGEHRAQCQGTMAVCGWEEVDLVLFYTGWPNPPVFNVKRDDIYIANLEKALEAFDHDLHSFVAKRRAAMRSMWP